jgi:hypothetical protein
LGRHFETLSELFVASSGWRRIRVTGGTRETGDIELLLLSTKE